MQAWSAVSASLVLIVIAMLMWSAVFPVWVTILVAIAGYVGLEFFPTVASDEAARESLALLKG